jgi:putative spermidine/putrescine transport system substrate-binding protein
MRNLPLRPVALLLLIGLASSGPVLAAGQITFVSQGGSYQEAQTKAILDPAAKLLGITVNQDSIPDAWPAIKAQGATGKPIWDVVDTPTSNCRSCRTPPRCRRNTARHIRLRTSSIPP